MRLEQLRVEFCRRIPAYIIEPSFWLLATYRPTLHAVVSRLEGAGEYCAGLQVSL